MIFVFFLECKRMKLGACSKVLPETETKDKIVTLISAEFETSAPGNTSDLKHATTCCSLKSALRDTTDEILGRNIMS